MAIYLLDTNAVSDLMHKHPLASRRMFDAGIKVLTSVIVRGEIRYGLARLPAGKRRETLAFLADELLETIPNEPVTPVIAEQFGILRRELELKGVSCDDNDLWIAATSMILGATVVSRDQIFNRIPGLTVEDWTLSP